MYRVLCIRNYVLLKPRNLTRQKYTRCRSILEPAESSRDLIGSIIWIRALNYFDVFDFCQACFYNRTIWHKSIFKLSIDITFIAWFIVVVVKFREAAVMFNLYGNCH